jgi:Ca2+/Na+ antiporter
MNIQIKKLLITFILLALAAISPNLFVAAQAGIATFSSLAIEFLVPSFALILLVIVISKLLKYTDIFRLAVNGILAGIISTVALEIFRELGFRFGMMPGDLPRLMGVILLNQFSSGPDIWSDLAGWSYHAWNGAAFGLIFSLVLGQSEIWQGFLYGLLIGIGFMISPVVKSLGIGLFGINFKDGYQFALTVTIAHAAFGLALSFLLMKWNKGISNICLRWKNKL